MFSNLKVMLVVCAIPANLNIKNGGKITYHKLFQKVHTLIGENLLPVGLISFVMTRV